MKFIDAQDINSGLILPARLGSGTPDASTFLRGDNSWAAVAPEDIDGTLSPAQLGSGTPDASTFLRGDGEWSAVPFIPLPSSTISGTTAAAVNTSYLVNGGSQVTLTLPASSAVGSVIEVIDFGGNGWRINQGSGQSIRVGGSNTTTGASGYLTSVGTGAAIRLICVVANQTWLAIAGAGAYLLDGANAVNLHAPWRTVVSATEPTTKARCFWWEVDGSGNLLHGFPWSWNGTYWLSPPREISVVQRDTPSLTSASMNIFYYPLGNLYNVFIRFAWANTFISPADNSSNYWRLDLQRSTSNLGNTTIAEIGNTISSASGVYSRLQNAAINTHINLSGTGTLYLSLRVEKIGSPPSTNLFYGNGTVFYHYARL